MGKVNVYILLTKVERFWFTCDVFRQSLIELAQPVQFLGYFVDVCLNWYEHNNNVCVRLSINVLQCVMCSR